jgi:hypothetical protein
MRIKCLICILRVLSYASLLSGGGDDVIMHCTAEAGSTEQAALYPAPDGLQNCDVSMCIHVAQRGSTWQRRPADGLALSFVALQESWLTIKMLKGGDEIEFTGK